MELIKKSLLPLLLVIIVACSWVSPFDSLAIEKVDVGLKRALISFATARTLNALVSVLQGTDIAIEPMCVGVKLAVGQALDPINDLIKKFSNLMLAASISFGIQHVLISIGGHKAVSIALTLASLLWGALYFRHASAPSWMTKILVVTIVLRFAIPAVTLGTDILFQQFLAKEYSTSQTFIEMNASDALKSLPQVSIPENPSLWNKMKSVTPADINISQRIDRITQAAEQWPEHFIRLMVVFLLETLIIPLTLLWLLVSWARNYL